jgi:hypothetical protein
MMELRRRGNTFGAVALGVALAAALIGARAQAGQAGAGQSASGGTSSASGQAMGGAAVKTAAEQFKNIQVLKDIPAYQLTSTMDFISASLGVGCDFCHVDDAKDKDDKQNKLTARKMMLMTMDINKASFEGHQEVTCFTCHKGTNDPVSVPMVIAENEPPRVPPQPPPANMPTADQLIDKYVQAVGGADAVNKVTSRVEKGNVIVQGSSIPIAVYAKAPNKRISITKSPNGESSTAFDGTIGWLGGGRGPRVMNPTETQASKMDADIHFATDVKKTLTRLRVGRPDKIGDTEMYVVVGQAADQTAVRLYFDEKTGLLTRLVRYTPTAFGRLPTQIDYADYRDVDGVKIPFRWTLARVNGRFTIQIDTAQQNVPIDDSKFTKPEGGAPGQGGPQH